MGQIRSHFLHLLQPPSTSSLTLLIGLKRDSMAPSGHMNLQNGRLMKTIDNSNKNKIIIFM